MKIGIAGSGFVGATAAYALVMRGVATEVVLVDVNQKRAQAEAADILHAVPFVHPVEVMAGEYADLAGSGVVIITAGVAQKPGETRLQLMERNAVILRQIVPQVIEHAPQAILIITTNPVDVMTHLATKIAADYGIPSHRIMGSGTTLDTARFRALLGTRLGVDPQHVHGYVIGEHGDSEVLTWSIVDIGGLPLEDFAQLRGIPLDDPIRAAMDDEVRHAAYTIIEGKGATYYGIGAALTRIVDVIAHDHRAILTVCSLMPEVAGVHEVTLSLPHLVGGSGVMEALPLKLNAWETSALHASARLIRTAMDELEQSHER